MAHVSFTHYDTLQVRPDATPLEIKQAYRRMVKLFHPDSHQDATDSDQIIRINAAYEILKDAAHRRSYDRTLGTGNQYSSQTGARDRSSQTTQKQYKSSRKTGRAADEQLEKWLQQVYQPVNRLLCRVLNSLEAQIDELAADPFDDELIEEFQNYLNTCRDILKQAQGIFRSMPNPPSVAGAAVHLYYCLNHLADGLDELDYFPLNYDDRYLHIGQELFRIAAGLHCEVQVSLEAIK